MQKLFMNTWSYMYLFIILSSELFLEFRSQV